MPNLIDRFTGWLRRPDRSYNYGLDVRQGPPATVERWMQDRPIWDTRDVGQSIEKHYLHLSLVFRPVGVLADAVAEAPLRCYRLTDGEKEELPNRPIRRLIANPNPQMSESEFHVFTVTIMALAGYCVIEKVRSEAGRVVQLWHLRPDWLKPIYRSGRPADWEYRVPGNDPVTLDARDVIAVPFRHSPQFKATGVAPLDTVFREVGVEHAATDYLKATFDRGGGPMSYLAWSPVSDQDKKRTPDRAFLQQAQDLWNSKVGGSENWDRFPVMAQFEPKTIGWSPEELAYPELRDMLADRICSAFGVDKRLISVGDDPTFENLKEQRAILQEMTCNPLRARLDGAYTRSLLYEFGENDDEISLEFDTSKIAALQDDTNEVHERARSNFSVGGLRVNEFRSIIGMPDEPGPLGEAYKLDQTSMFILADGTVVASTFSDPTQETTGVATDAARTVLHSADFGVGERAIPASGSVVEWHANDDDLVIARVLDEHGDGVSITTLRRYMADIDAIEERATLLPTDTRAAAVDKARETYGRIGEKHEPKVAAFFRSQGERIADAAAPDALFDRSVDPGASERVLALGTERRDLTAINWDDESNQLRDVLSDLYDDAGIAAFEQVAELMERIGVADFTVVYDKTNPGIKPIADDLGKRIVGITDETRRRVADVIADALTDKAGGREVAKRLRAEFAEMAGKRANVVARTESQFAYNRSNVLAYRESGVVSAVQLHDNASHTDSYGASDGLSCAQRNGLVAPLSEADRHVNAEHPNGSLAVAPVLSKPL